MAGPQILVDLGPFIMTLMRSRRNLTLVSMLASVNLGSLEVFCLKSQNMSMISSDYLHYLHVVVEES